VSLTSFLRRLLSRRIVRRDGKTITVLGVSHDVGNEEIGKHVASQPEDVTVLVEMSLYLGGFIPRHAQTDHVVVIVEPPTMFSKSGRPTEIYSGGRAIPAEARGARRFFETIAEDLDEGLDRRSALRTVNDLLQLRAKSPDLIVYNEPQAWLRTVWYESDLMFHYVFGRHDFPLFGAIIYSELDAAFGSFLERSGNALSAMTGDDCLLFAFDGVGGRDSDLHNAARYVAYRAVVDIPTRLGDSLSVAELDALRERETQMLADIRGVNRSLLFGRRLGVAATDTPCVVFWRSLDDDRIVTVPFAAYRDDESRIEAMKALADIIHSAVSNADPLESMKAMITARLTSTAGKIGDAVRSFLFDHALPPRDRLTIDEIDAFERVRAVKTADVMHLLDGNGYLDVSEDHVQLALEEILSVPFHKKDWGGEMNDLYVGTITVSGVPLAAAFLLKGNGLRRAEMRIADLGKNGDQLLRLFDSPAALFVVQFVGRIAEAVIADVQGKVAQRRAAGQQAWFLIMDGADTARLLFAHDKLAVDRDRPE
jgi:hypothetical protein